jgi:hypothetical protein
MTKIKNTVAYKLKNPLSLNDFAVGTNNESNVPGFVKGQTISIGLNELRELFLQGLSPEVGGVFKITEIDPITEQTSISAVANAFSPAYTVQRYELVAINLNGVIYLLKSQNITFGIGQDALTDDDFIKFTSIVNKGTGQQMCSYNPTLKQYEILTIDSETLTKTVDANGLHLEIPSTSSIPSLYVNTLYIPTQEEFLAGNTKGFGTLAKPFTNTITAYVDGVPTITANSAIKNALDAYVGTGTGTRLNPELSGQRIIVQNNNTGYITSENFSYNNLYLVAEQNISSTTTGYIVDMDNATYFDATNGTFTIEVKEGFSISASNSLGFRNSGNTDTINPFSTGRTGIFLGEGEIFSNYNGADVLTRYILNGEGNFNNGNLHFQVRCKLRATHQGIYFSKNNQRIDFYNNLSSGIFIGTVNLALKAFHMTGGQVRFYEKGSIYIAAEGSGRTYAITFAPSGDGLLGNTNFQLNSAKITGNMQYCFARLNNEPVNFLAFNSPSGSGFSTTNPGTNTIIDGLFENTGGTKWSVDFKNNVFAFTGIDQNKVDLTQGNTSSAINFIGNNIIQNLVAHPSRNDASAAGLSVGSTFLNRKTVNEVDLLAGVEYQVLTPGSPGLGAVGSYFTATGSETGTGTAYAYMMDILI